MTIGCVRKAKQQSTVLSFDTMSSAEIVRKDSLVAYADCDDLKSEPEASKKPASMIRNAHLAAFPHDHLYHFGLDSHQPLQEMFGDIRAVFIGGSVGRMAGVAQRAMTELGLPLPCGQSLTDISTTDRYFNN